MVQNAKASIIILVLKLKAPALCNFDLKTKNLVKIEYIARGLLVLKSIIKPLDIGVLIDFKRTCFYIYVYKL